MLQIAKKLNLLWKDDFRNFLHEPLYRKWFMLIQRFQGNFKSIEPSYFIEAMDMYRQEFRFERKITFHQMASFWNSSIGNFVTYSVPEGMSETLWKPQIMTLKSDSGQRQYSCNVFFLQKCDLYLCVGWHWLGEDPPTCTGSFPPTFFAGNHRFSVQKVKTGDLYFVEDLLPGNRADSLPEQVEW